MPSRKVASAAVAVSSGCLALAVWKVLQWRARKRALKMVKSLRKDGPLVDHEDVNVRERILTAAIKRASKWMSLFAADAKPMVGQVGGISVHKKPLLTLEPDYVLKPVIPDHRGIREIAFYEAVKTLQSKKSVLYSKKPVQQQTTTTNSLVGEWFDTIAMALAMILQDRVVLDSEAELRQSRKNAKKELDMLRQLYKFTPHYYGVLGQDAVVPNSPMGISDDAHLLLQDLTINYSKPCIMDLKMGTQSYEPDATDEKRLRESSKYPEQAQFGFRIVGMRLFDYSAEKQDYKFYRKPYGRSLKTYEQVKEAFRVFLTLRKPEGENKAVVNGRRSENNSGGTTTGAKTTTKLKIRSISNLLVQLRSIRRWFEENTVLRFCASSLLVVYEGCDETSHNVSIKMIDFGRIRRERGGDPGYIHGLRTLQQILTDLLEEEQTTQSSQAE